MRLSPKWAAILIPVLIGAWMIATPFAYRASAQVCYNPDPFQYGEIAKLMMAGKQIYTQIRYDKGPLALFYYAIPAAIAPHSYSGMEFFNGVWIDLQALLFIWVLRRNRAACLACTILITTCPLIGPDYVWPSMEQASNLFIVANLLLAWVICRDGQASPWHCLLAGAFMTITFNIRQNAVFASMAPGMAVLLCPLPWKMRLRGIGLIATGAMAMMIPILGIVSIMTDIKAYFHAMILDSAKYAEVGKWSDSAGLLIRLLFSPIFAILAFVLTLSLFSRFRRLALTAILFALVTIILPKRNFGHYLMSLVPAMTLLVAVGLHETSRRSTTLQWICPSLIAAILVPLACTQIRAARRQPMLPSVESIAGKIDRDAPDKGTLMVIGPHWPPATAINYCSRLEPAGFIWVDWKLSETFETAVGNSLADITADYLAKPPTVIAVNVFYVQPGLAINAPGEDPFRGWIFTDHAGDSMSDRHNNLEIFKKLLQQNKYQLKESNTTEGYWTWYLQPVPGK